MIITCAVCDTPVQVLMSEHYQQFHPQLWKEIEQHTANIINHRIESQRRYER